MVDAYASVEQARKKVQ